MTFPAWDLPVRGVELRGGTPQPAWTIVGGEGLCEDSDGGGSWQEARPMP